MISDIAAFDVASKKLVVWREGVPLEKFDNDRKSILSYLKGLARDVVIALEATGGYGHLLANLACKCGHTVYMLQPGKVKDYCKSSPTRGKSDAKDAENIACYVRSFEKKLHPYTPKPPFEKKLQQLYRKREAMTDKLASLRSMMRSLGDSPKEVEATLARLLQRTERLSAQINQMLDEAPDAKVLFSIPAVKQNFVAAVLPALRTIPFRSKYALDSFAGIDLKENQSGQWQGRRYISHQGDPHIRRAVYMAGLSGITCKIWRPYYDKLIEKKRLKPIQAIIALGRKILHTVYGVYRTQKPFTPPSQA